MKPTEEIVRPTTVLIVDDEPAGRIMSRTLLVDNPEVSDPINILEATNIPDALQILSQTPIDVILLDMNVGPTPDDVSQNGVESIPEMRNLRQSVKILVITSSQKDKDRERAIQLGAFGFITKSNPVEEKQKKVAEAVSAAHTAFDKILNNRTKTEQLKGPVVLGGKSVPWRRTMETVQQYAPNDFAILLTGDTGTGKTELARYAHWEVNPLKQRPFVAINIASLSSEIAERELFGNERGAYTGAVEAKMGYFELANGGTIFLDEIGDADLDLQKKILTVFEEGRLWRLGGTREIQVQFKPICATHKNLEKLVEEGKFREDLYMRISTLTVQVPPLSERREDIPYIAEAMLPRIAAKAWTNVQFDELPDSFIKYLTDTPFRGNARGIYQQMARLIAKAPTDRKGKKVYTNWRRLLRLDTSPLATPPPPKALTLHDILNSPLNLFEDDFNGIAEVTDAFKDRIYIEAQDKFKDIRAVARHLDVSPSTAYENLKRLTRLKSPKTEEDDGNERI